MIDCVPAPGGGRFAATGERWAFAGTLNFADAAAVFAASRSLQLPASGMVDLSGLGRADSAALAVMVALKRRAAGEGVRLQFTSIPAGIQALAHVYGVDALLAA